MNKGAKTGKTINIKATIFIYFLFLALFLFLFFYFDNFIVKTVCIVMLAIVTACFIGDIVGLAKAQVQISKENKYIKNTNPYIYYRYLPNNFGIGVTTLLFDSTIENYKDIVAVILDLCAKKYLSLIKQNDKYVVKVLKNIDDNLLSNEKYILTLIMNNNIKNIDYKEWYNYCVQDGVELGLYSKRKVNIDTNNSPYTMNILKKANKVQFVLCILISILGLIIILSRYYIKGSLDSPLNHSVISFIGFIIICIFLVSILTLITYGILFIPFHIILLYVIIPFTHFEKVAENANYKTLIEGNLKKTKKGVEELHKLYSFKAFINDFGNFVDKKAEEVVLWDRYLSYAQVFGLTKEIMKSGYKELVNNSSFQIDDIDNINLENIEINKI